ncbi:MAG: DUF1295 domain-containing protein [Gemmatimonadota bacterium]
MSPTTSYIGVALSVALLAALAWAGGQGGASVGGVSVFAVCVGVAAIVQWLAFVPAYLARTEKFYDLTGSLTYLTVVALAVALSGSRDLGSLLLAVLVGVWAARLGSFLFLRIKADGKDGRFDELKTSFPRFLLAWTLQALWISFTAGAALAAITAVGPVPLGTTAMVGLAIWIFGFGVEVVSDRQKSAFRKNPANKGRFITTGLWAWSRHPNYFGEIVLWVGVAVIASPALGGWQYVTLSSPLFVTALLTMGSGIPLLEERADARWGGEPEYEAYKANTPVLVPRPPRAG